MRKVQFLLGLFILSFSTANARLVLLDQASYSSLSVKKGDSAVMLNDITFSGNNPSLKISDGAVINTQGFQFLNAVSLDLKGTIYTAHPNGLTGLNAVFPAGSIFSLAPGSMVVYNAETGTQQISNDLVYASLRLEGKTIKVFANATFQVLEDLSAATDAINIQQGSKTKFSLAGNNTQTISFPYFYDVELSGNSTKTLASKCVIRGLLKLLDRAVLSTGDSLVIGSSATYQGRVFFQSTREQLVGKVIVQRFIPSSSNKWRFLSTALVNSTFNQGWQKNIHITGAGSGGTLGTLNSNGFDYTQSAAPSIYYYDETLPGTSSLGWRAISSTYDTIKPGFGYRVFVRGDKITQGINLINGSVITPADVTIEETGVLNRGDITLPISCSIECGVNDGWNMVANPYANFINWDNDAWTSTRTGLSPTIYIYNPATGNYGCYNALVGGINGATGIISPNQSFFVKASANTNLTFKEAYCTDSISKGLFGKAATTDIGRIQLKHNGKLMDEAVVFQHPDATNGYNDRLDALKFSGGSYALATYTNIDKKLLAFNGMRMLNEINRSDTVYLSVTVPNENDYYELNFIGDASYAKGKSIFLFDVAEGRLVQLTRSQSYRFFVSTDQKSMVNGRFRLYLEFPSSLPVEYSDFSGLYNGKSVELKWATFSEQNNQYFEILRSEDGQKFSSLGKVKGALNSSVQNKYTFTDQNPPKEIAYYKLKQVDADGKFAFSNTIYVYMNKSQDERITIFPVPSLFDLEIRINSFEAREAELTITSMSGKTVITQTLTNLSAGCMQHIDISSLQTGVYILVLKDKSGVQKEYKAKFIRE